MLSKTRNFFIILLSSILCVLSLGFSLFTAKAETVPYYYSSDVLKDLDCKTEDEAKLMFPLVNDLQLVRFFEYGVGTSDFGVYVIFYNANGLNIQDSERDKIQIGFEDEQSKIFQATYKKYNLIYLDSSENNLFIKYYVDGISRSGATDRFYCVSGAELWIDGNPNCTEFGVSRIFHCKTEGNSTSISTESLDSLEVPVTHTFYRTDFSNKGDLWFNQLSSCYFSLPALYSGENNKLGELSRISAEFYNYFTDKILVTTNYSVYECLNAHVFNDLSSEIIDLSLFFGWYDRSSGQVFTHDYYKYHLGSNNGLYGQHADSEIDMLKWLFYFDIDDSFLPNNFLFDGSYLSSYFNSFVNSSVLPYDEAREYAISTLFISPDEYYNSSSPYNLLGLDYGYNLVDYFIDSSASKLETSDNKSISSLPLFKDDSSWLLKLFGSSSSEELVLSPIVKVNPEDAWGDTALSDSVFSEKYFVHVLDVPKLKEYCYKRNILSNDVYLFRYDVSEYFYADDSTGPYNGPSDRHATSFIAQESVYLDFDLISFGFEQNNEIYSVPVVHSPTDEFPDLTPGGGMNNGCSEDVSCLDGLRYIFGLILLVLAFLLLARLGILKYILKGFLWLLKAPFLLIKKIKETADKNSSKRLEKNKQKVKKLKKQNENKAVNLEIKRLRSEKKALSYKSKKGSGKR